MRKKNYLIGMLLAAALVVVGIGTIMANNYPADSLKEESHIYAQVTLNDDRVITLRTNSTVEVLDPEGYKWGEEADWWEGEDGVIVIFTGEGTRHWSIIDDYIYDGYYRDGQCWNEELVNGDLEDVGYTPNHSNGERLKNIKFYKDREKYRNMTKLMAYDFVEREDRWLGDDYLTEYCVRRPEEIEKNLKDSGLVLYSTKNIEVVLGDDEPSPAIEKIYKSSDCKVKIIIGEYNYNQDKSIADIEIEFSDQEAMYYFVSKLKSEGWTQDGNTYVIDHHSLIQIYIEGNVVHLDIGP